MAFSWWRNRGASPAPTRHPGAAPARSREDRAEVHRQWSLRFEDGVRLALADLADELEAARRATGAQSQALHLAAMRDAIERVAREQQDPAVSRACELFDRLVGQAGAPLALRHEAAQLALDTLTFLVLADAVERKARAATALAQLELAAQRALAA
jgi:hypothetical protein